VGAKRGWVFCAHMSIKINFLVSHLNFFPEDLGAVSEEHGERFYRNTLCVKKTIPGHMGIYISIAIPILKHDVSQVKYS
jgi:hypothetical protein